MATHAQQWPAGTPCWIEIVVGDLQRSRQFYRSVLGWEFEGSGEESGGVDNALVDGRRVAGMSVALEGADTRSAGWTTYFATDDLDTTARAAAGAGAVPLMEPVDLGAIGRLASWVEPAGAAFGARESREHTGHEALDGHGTVGWVDLVSGGTQASKAFYGTVFGLTFEDMAMVGISYSTFTPPGEHWPAGGMGDMQPGDALGPRWCVTFEVDDVEVARQLVIAAGGDAPHATGQFEFGAIATVRGPDGEEFSLMTSTTPPEAAPTPQ